MAVLSELLLTRPYGEDAAGKKLGARIWHAPVTSDGAARALFNEFPEHRTFPGEDGLKFDNFRVDPNPTGAGYTVTANFSSFGAGRFSRLPERNGEPRWLWGQRRVLVECPRYKFVQRVMGEGDSAVEKHVWITEKINIPAVRTLFILKVRVETDNILIFNPIAEQTERIHTLGGKKYQFVGGEVSEGDGTYFNATYTWEEDKGTPGLPPGQPTRILILNASNAPEGMLRGPYQTLDEIPSDEPEVYPGETIGLYLYPDDPNGWQSLPGVPPL